MRLANVARYFDRLAVYDGYTREYAFKAQFDLYDDSKRDAAGVLRRVLSASPDVVVPARGVIEAPVGKRWLVGSQDHADTFGDGSIRKKFVLQSADRLCYLRTPAQAAAGAGGTALYAGFAWMKDWKEVEFNSRAYPYYEIYCNKSESVKAGDYLVDPDNKVFRVRSAYDSEAGFRVAEADDLEAAIKPLTITTPGSFDPVADTLTAPNVAGYGLVMRFAANFEYLQESAVRRQDGDIIAVVPKDTFAAVSSNDKVLLGSESYIVVSSVTEQDAWRLHLRP